MSNKKEKRIEAKKKSVIAFLNLVKGNSDICVEKEQDGGSRNQSSHKNRMSEEAFQESKRLLRERQKAGMQKPKLFLTLDELTRDYPGLENVDEVKQTPPLFMVDLQHLVSYGIQQMLASTIPRWCRLLRPSKVSKMAVVVLDSVSSREFEKYTASLPTLQCAFDIQVEMVSPLQYGSSVREDLLNVPMSITQVRRRISVYGAPKENKELLSSCRITKRLHEDPLVSFDDLAKARQGQGDEPVTKKAKMADGEQSGTKKGSDPEGASVSTYTLDVVNRLALLLSPQQMLCEQIPMPVAKGHAGSTGLVKKNQFPDFVYTKPRYDPVTERSPIFAVDCEMVQTKSTKMDLARISIVNEQLQTVYDSYVKPYSTVTDYVTRYSGITKQILDNVWARIEDVQHTIQMALPSDAILCGQSIGSDLRSMKMFHPYLIDTSVIYNLTGDRRKKTGLRRLADEFLGQTIQDSRAGHSSVEDAQATMELVLLKLRRGIAFGDTIMTDFAAPTIKDEIKEEPAANISPDCSQPKCLNDTAVSVTTTEADNERTECNDKDTSSSVTCSDISPASEEVKEIVPKQCDGTTDATTVTENNQNSDSDNLCSTCNSQKDQETVTKNENLITSALNKQLNDVEAKQRRSFFQRDGSLFVENFFQVLERSKKSGRIMDEGDSVDLYPSVLQPCLRTCDNDKERAKLTREALKDVDFTFTHLYGYRDFLSNSQGDCEEDEEEKKKVLWKLDRRFWQILTEMPDSCMYIVVLTGRSTDTGVHPAMSFAKIT